MQVTAMHLNNWASGDSVIIDGMVFEICGVSSEVVSLFSPCDLSDSLSIFLESRIATGDLSRR